MLAGIVTLLIIGLNGWLLCDRAVWPRRRGIDALPRPLVARPCIEHILIPLDNSPADEAILTHIRQLARLTGARLTLVHVADGFMARNQKRLGLDESDRDARRPRLSGPPRGRAGRPRDFKVDAILECGEPADQILAIAEREACDLIAMSTHGHRFLSDLILGSVAEQVRHRTGIPVLLIRRRRRRKGKEISPQDAEDAERKRNRHRERLTRRWTLRFLFLRVLVPAVNHRLIFMACSDFVSWPFRSSWPSRSPRLSTSPRSVARLTTSISTPFSCSLAVSRYIGALANRRSLSSQPNGARPSWPRPMWACRSTREPSGLLAVVQVKRLHAIEADGRVELGHRRAVLLFGLQRIAGGKDVAGVEADAQPLALRASAR